MTYPATNPTKISQSGINLITSFEGLHDLKDYGYVHAYRCPAGVITIGYGTTGADYPGLSMADIWTVDKCKEVFAKSLSKYETAVMWVVEVPLTQNQFDACVSFCYNCGPNAFRSSTLLKKLNAKDYEGAANEFLKWNKANGQVLNGLTRRREAERKLFLA